MDFFLVAIFVLICQQFLSRLTKLAKPALFKIGFYLLMSLTVVNLILTAQNYHPLTPAKQPFNRIAKFLEKRFPLSQRKEYSIYTFGNEFVWYQTMVYKNWANPSIYSFFLNDLGPYLNVFYRLPSANIFSASYFAPNRQYYFDQKIKQSLIDTLKNEINVTATFNPVQDYQLFLNNVYHHQVQISKKSLNLLKIKGVKFFITPVDYVSSDKFRKIDEIKTRYDNNDYYLRVYEIRDPYPRFYLLKDLYYMNVEDDLDRLLDAPWQKRINFSFREKEIPMRTKTADCLLRLDSWTKDNLQLTTDCNRPAYIGSTLAYFPGIKAYTADNKRLRLDRINLNQMSIKAPQGKTKITIAYRPDWSPFPLVVTIIAFLALLATIIAALI